MVGRADGSMDGRTTAKAAQGYGNKYGKILNENHKIYMDKILKLIKCN